MSSATNRASNRAQRRDASTDEVVLRDLAALEPRPTFLLADDDVRLRWERIARGDRA